MRTLSCIRQVVQVSLNSEYGSTDYRETQMVRLRVVFIHVEIRKGTV
jgi:hypothetical protein